MGPTCPVVDALSIFVSSTTSDVVDLVKSVGPELDQPSAPWRPPAALLKAGNGSVTVTTSVSLAGRPVAAALAGTGHASLPVAVDEVAPPSEQQPAPATAVGFARPINGTAAPSRGVKMAKPLALPLPRSEEAGAVPEGGDSGHCDVEGGALGLFGAAPAAGSAQAVDGPVVSGVDGVPASADSSGRCGNDVACVVSVGQEEGSGLEPAPSAGRGAADEPAGFEPSTDDDLLDVFGYSWAAGDLSEEAQEEATEGLDDEIIEVGATNACTRMHTALPLHIHSIGFFQPPSRTPRSAYARLMMLTDC
jgi:hypothetical protein